MIKVNAENLQVKVITFANVHVTDTHALASDT